MRIFRWSPKFSPGSESSCAPVWVGLPALKAHLQNPGAIQSITGLLGKYLCAHSDVYQFTRPGYTCICVEMDLSKPRKHTIKIDNGGELVDQRVVYDQTLPPFCNFCMMVGHLPSDCRRQKERLEKEKHQEKLGIDLSSQEPITNNKKVESSRVNLSKNAKKRLNKKLRVAGLTAQRSQKELRDGSTTNKGQPSTGIVIRGNNEDQYAKDLDKAKKLSLVEGKGKKTLIEGHISDASDEEEWISIKHKKYRARGESSGRWTPKVQDGGVPLLQELEQIEKPPSKMEFLSKLANGEDNLFGMPLLEEDDNFGPIE